MTTRHVAVLVGSLRKGSLKRKVALALAALVAPALDLVEVPEYSMLHAELTGGAPAVTVRYLD